MDSKFNKFVKSMNDKQRENKDTFTDFEVLPANVSEKIVGGKKSTVNNGCTINHGCKPKLTATDVDPK